MIIQNTIRKPTEFKEVSKKVVGEKGPITSGKLKSEKNFINTGAHSAMEKSIRTNSF